MFYLPFSLQDQIFWCYPESADHFSLKLHYCKYSFFDASLLEILHALNVSLFLFKDTLLFQHLAYTYYVIKSVEVAHKLDVLAIWVQTFNHYTFAPRLLPLPNKAQTVVVSGYFEIPECSHPPQSVCEVTYPISNIYVSLSLFFFLPANLLWFRILMQTLRIENRFCFPTVLNLWSQAKPF